MCFWFPPIEFHVTGGNQADLKQPSGLILAASSYTAYFDLRVQLARGKGLVASEALGVFEVTFASKGL